MSIKLSRLGFHSPKSPEVSPTLYGVAAMGLPPFLPRITITNRNGGIMKPSFHTVTVDGVTYPVKEVKINYGIGFDIKSDVGVATKGLLSDSDRAIILRRQRAIVCAGEVEVAYRCLPSDLRSYRLAELLWLQGECFERSVRRIDQYYRGNP